MLLSVRILNWKSHKDSFLQFKKGANLIVGKMGSGKSSVVDSICFALFGSFPKLSRKECTLKDLLNFNLENEPTKIELVFEDSSKEEKKIYRVVRNITESKATLYLNDKVVCTGNALVNKQLENILKVDYDLFTKAVYGEQNNLNYWLELPPSKKKAQLDELLGIDKFESIRVNLISYMNKQNQRLEQIQSFLISEEVKKLEQEYLEHLDKINQKEKELKFLEEESEKIFQNYTLLSNEYSLQNELYNRHISLEKKLAVLSSKLCYLKEELTKIKEEDINELEKKKSFLSKEINNIKNKLEELEKNYKNSLLRYQQIKTEIVQELKNKKILDELEQKKRKFLEDFSSLEELIKNLDETKKELEKLTDSVSFLKQRNESLLFSINSLKEHQTHKKSLCPLCKQQLSEESKNKLIEEYSLEISLNKNKISSFSSEISNIENKIKNLEQRANNLWLLEEQKKKFSLTKDITSLDVILNNLNSELKNLEIEKKQLQQNFEGLNKELFSLNQKFEDLKKVEKFKKEISQTEKDFLEIKTKLDSLTFSKEKMEEVFKKLQQALEKKTLVEEKIKSCKELMDSYLQTKRIYLNQIEELNKKKEELKNLRNEIDKLKAFEQVLILTQVQLREYILLKLNNALQVLWPFIYSYTDWSSMRIISSEKGYLIQLLQNDWKNVDVFPSGGERACAALCLRIALSFLLTPSLSWLILDEPTHNLDELTVLRLAEALNTQLPILINQLVIITHDERLVQPDSCHLIKLEREKSPNSFTKVTI